MNVTTALETLRESIPGCDVAILVDLSTSMVLSSAAARRLPQEDLDVLANQAGDVLKGPLAEAALQSDNEATSEAMQSLLSTSETTRLFLRAAADRSEAMVCVVGATTNLVDAFQKGNDALQAIMSDD